jgi:hypothetical protein
MGWVWLGMVVHTCNLSTQEAEAGGSWVEVRLENTVSSRPASAVGQGPVPKKTNNSWALMPIILATQEAEIKRIAVRRQPGQIVCPILKKTLHKEGLVEWLKV